MDYHVLEVRHVAGHVVWLRFRDGTVGEVDLASELRGSVFEPLRDPEIFKQFRVDPDFHTLVWANGADLAPEFLHRSVRVTALTTRRRLSGARAKCPAAPAPFGEFGVYAGAVERTDSRDFARLLR